MLAGTLILMTVVAGASSRLRIEADQQVVVLGGPRLVSLTITVEGASVPDDRLPELRANIGELVGGVRRAGKDRYLAIYEPPRSARPAVALILARLDGGERSLHGATRILML